VDEPPQNPSHPQDNEKDSASLIPKFTIGLAKTHVQHVITDTAINFSRPLAWLMDIPLDGTRVSRFAALAL